MRPGGWLLCGAHPTLPLQQVQMGCTWTWQRHTVRVKVRGRKPRYLHTRTTTGHLVPVLPFPFGSFKRRLQEEENRAILKSFPHWGDRDRDKQLLSQEEWVKTHVLENLYVLDITQADMHPLNTAEQWYYGNLNNGFQSTKLTYSFIHVILTNWFYRYRVVWKHDFWIRTSLLSWHGTWWMSFSLCHIFLMCKMTVKITVTTWEN